METWAIFFPAFLCFLSAFAGIVSMRIEYSCTYVCVCVCLWICRCRFSTSSRLPYARCIAHCGSYHKNLLLFTYPFPAPNVLCIRTRVFLVCFYILVSCSSFPFDGWFLAKYLRFSEQQHYVYKCAFFFLFLSLFIESVVSSDIAYQNQPKIYVRISVSPFWLIHSMSS